jgi:hypothetical protein
MLQQSENMLIEAEEQCDILGRLVDQAQQSFPTAEITAPGAIAKVVEESLERGWIFSDFLHDLISKMDARLAAFSIEELAQVFDFPEVQVWANTAKSIPTTANNAVAIRNAAFLLIQLRAMGFRIDDTLLSSRLRPALEKKRFLVGREFYIYWQKELEAKREAFVLYCAPASPASAAREVTLPLSHIMRIIHEGERIIGVEVTPPSRTTSVLATGTGSRISSS